MVSFLVPQISLRIWGKNLPKPHPFSQNPRSQNPFSKKVKLKDYLTIFDPSKVWFEGCLRGFDPPKVRSQGGCSVILCFLSFFFCRFLKMNISWVEIKQFSKMTPYLKPEIHVPNHFFWYLYSLYMSNFGGILVGVPQNSPNMIARHDFKHRISSWQRKVIKIHPFHRSKPPT